MNNKDEQNTYSGLTDLLSAEPFAAGTRVYVTRPDGQRVGFTFNPQPVGGFGFATYLPNFTPDPGVDDRLEPADLSGGLWLIGGAFYAFIIPFRVQCLKAGLLDKDKYDYQKPNRILREFFKARDIPCLDFLQIYDQMEPKSVRSFYYRKDMHWTAAGHRHAAKALTRFLCETNKQFKPTAEN